MTPTNLYGLPASESDRPLAVTNPEFGAGVVAVGEGVGVETGVRVGVRAGVAVGVGVGVGVPVGVAVGVGVGDGERVTVPVGVIVIADAGVVGAAAGPPVALDVGVAVGVRVALGVGDIVGVADVPPFGWCTVLPLGYFTTHHLTPEVAEFAVDSPWTIRGVALPADTLGLSGWVLGAGGGVGEAGGPPIVVASRE